MFFYAQPSSSKQVTPQRSASHATIARCGGGHSSASTLSPDLFYAARQSQHKDILREQMPASERKLQPTLSSRSAPYSVSSLLRKSIESLKYVIGMPKFASPETNEPEISGSFASGAVDEPPAVVSEGTAPESVLEVPTDAPRVGIDAPSAENPLSHSAVNVDGASGATLSAGIPFSRLASYSEPLKPQAVRGPQRVSRPALEPLEVAKKVSRMGQTKPSLPKLDTFFFASFYDESAFGNFINTRKTHSKKQAAVSTSVAGASFVHAQSRTPAKSDPLDYALRTGTPQASAQSVHHLDFSQTTTPFIAPGSSKTSQVYGRSPNPNILSTPAVFSSSSRKRTHEDKSLLGEVLDSSVKRLNKRQARDFAHTEDKQKINRIFNALQTLNPNSSENLHSGATSEAAHPVSTLEQPSPNFKVGDIVCYDRAPTKCAKIIAINETDGSYEINYDGNDGNIQKNVSRSDVSSLSSVALPSRDSRSFLSSNGSNQTPKATSQLNPFMGRGAQNPTPSKKLATTPQSKFFAGKTPSDNVANSQQPTLPQALETQAPSSHVDSSKQFLPAQSIFVPPYASASAPEPAPVIPFGAPVSTPLVVAPAASEQPAVTASAFPAAASSSSAVFVFGTSSASAAVASNPFAPISTPAAAASASAPASTPGALFAGLSRVTNMSATHNSFPFSPVPSIIPDFSSYAPKPAVAAPAAVSTTALDFSVYAPKSSAPEAVSAPFGSASATPSFGAPGNPAPSFGGTPSFGAASDTPAFGAASAASSFGSAAPSSGFSAGNGSGFSFGGPMVSQPSQQEAEDGPQRSVLQQQKTLKYDSLPFSLLSCSF